jgi:hypothetical protein
MVIFMGILNSSWLIKMLEKSSPSPQMRMLNLFDILDDWLEAPNLVAPNMIWPEIREQFSSLQKPAITPLLQDFLTRQAAKAGAAMPEMLANQLYFMVLAAVQEKLQGLSNSESKHASLSHAKSAAKALIQAQTKKEFRITKSTVYATAASFFGALLVAGSAFYFAAQKSYSPTVSQTSLFKEDSQAVSAGALLSANPNDTAALFAQIEQMRKGNCQLIEALQLPDSYKKVYFENIVLGQISTDIKDQQLVRQLLDKVRCNYSPMLMVNSK